MLLATCCYRIFNIRLALIPLKDYPVDTVGNGRLLTNNDGGSFVIEVFSKISIKFLQL